LLLVEEFVMQLESQHVMVLAAEHPDGSQEWQCPTCGRRFIMKWQPEYSRAILEEGNPNAIHTGGTSGLHINLSIYEGQDTPEIYEDDPYLAPFQSWMEDREG
jgi:DNA-directed RNA polymerase subunit RPC12/RpoP